MTRSERIWDRAGLAVAAAAALVFAATYGWTYGVDNQVVYLLQSLRMLNPGILDHDWLATETTHYHPVYKYLAAGLMATGERSVGIAQTVVIAAGMLGAHGLLRALEGPRRGLAAFFLLAAVALVTRTNAACATYVFDHILQPSTLGSAAFLISVPLFVRGRWLASGIALAVSGMFHVNLLILFFGTYLLAHLAIGGEDLRRRLVRQLGPALAVLLLFLPMILGTAMAKDAKLAQEIYATIRAPHHHVIEGHERDFLPYIGWMLLGLGAAAPLAAEADSPYRRLAALLAALVAVTWGGIALASAWDVTQMRQLFPWRIVPHAQLLLGALACACAVRAIVEPAVRRRYGVVSVALMLGGVGVLSMFPTNRGMPVLHVLLAAAVGLLALVVAGSWLVERRAGEAAKARAAALWGKAALPLAFVAGLGAFVPLAASELEQFDRRSNVDDGLRAAETELYAWMRKNTPVDAVFLTPPDVETMRFHGQRAIVVDWKSNPVVPGELLEWYRRLEDVVGKKVRSVKDLDGYNALDEARLERLRARYKLDYVVVRRGKERALTKYRKVYSGPGYVVLDVKG